MSGIREHGGLGGFRRLLEAVQAEVPVERLAADVGTELRQHGNELRGRCPVHKGENPTAFVVRSDRQVWYCHRCGEGGDVLDLYQRINSYVDRTHALMDLTAEYNVPLPERPRSWFEKNRRQKPVREQIRAVRVEVLRRRLFKIIMLPLIKATTTDETSYRFEVEEAWREFLKVPVEMLLDRYDHGGRV